jgi:hypothetical protein
MVAAVLLVLLLGPIAWLATPAKHLQGMEKVDAINATRQLLLAAVGGLGLATGAAFGVRTFFLTRRGQFTDRYTKAIVLLASEKLTERLGGVYALEHLMADSERDHSTVVEVLAAFIREQTHAVAPPQDPGVRFAGPPPATDVQAAITALGRRPNRSESRPIDLTAVRLYGAKLSGLRLAGARLEEAQLDGADLNTADLRKAFLPGASLRHAGLARARLEQALLNQANLLGATLYQARLSGASLYDACLNGVNLAEAQLNGAVLAGSDLTGANLDRADLTGADLRSTDTQGTDLRQTTGLNRSQLRAAVTDDQTLLPAELNRRRRDTQND